MKTYARKLTALVSRLENVVEETRSDLGNIGLLVALDDKAAGAVLAADTPFAVMTASLSTCLAGITSFLSSNKGDLINGTDDLHAYARLYTELILIGATPFQLLQECMEYEDSSGPGGSGGAVTLATRDLYAVLPALIEAFNALKKQVSIEYCNARSADDFIRRAASVEGRLATIRRVYLDTLAEIQEKCTFQLEIGKESGPDVVHMIFPAPTLLADSGSGQNETHRGDVDPRVPGGRKFAVKKVTRQTYNSIESFISAFDPNTYADDAVYVTHALSLLSADGTEATNITELDVHVFCEATYIHAFLARLNAGVSTRESNEWNIESYYGKDQIMTFILKLLCFHLVKNGIVSLED
jgi:hypothetical protein